MNDDVVVDQLDLLDAAVEGRRSIGEEAAGDSCDCDASRAQRCGGGHCVSYGESTFQG